MAGDIILLRNIYKSFGSHEVLKDVSFTISKGEIYGLLGPSGCGKTTSVKIAAGISEATAGEVFVDGIKMPSLDAMQKIGYMAQSDALYGNISARENLIFFGTVFGIAGDELNERIEYAANLVNLNSELEKRVLDYSGGMKRRLSLAATVLHNPDILILDEPTVGIDPLLRKDIWNELYRLAGLGKAILVTTHVMDEAEKCTRISMMRDGMLIAEGKPEEIKRNVSAETMDEAFITYSEREKV